jgi:hypothetical protein
VLFSGHLLCFQHFLVLRTLAAGLRFAETFRLTRAVKNALGEVGG